MTTHHPDHDQTPFTAPDVDPGCEDPGHEPCDHADCAAMNTARRSAVLTAITAATEAGCLSAADRQWTVLADLVCSTLANWGGLESLDAAPAPVADALRCVVAASVTDQAPLTQWATIPHLVTLNVATLAAAQGITPAWEAAATHPDPDAVLAAYTDTYTAYANEFGHHLAAAVTADHPAGVRFHAITAPDADLTATVGNNHPEWSGYAYDLWAAAHTATGPIPTPHIPTT